MLSLLWIIVAFGLVLLNAFFVAAEFGMVRLRSTRIEVIQETYGISGKILSRVHKDLDAYLSACQLGITLASLGLGWIGEPAVSDLLSPFLHSLGVMSPAITELIAFLVAFSLLSFLHIVVGELMPKSLAIRQPERVSIWTAVPLYLFYWVMFPAIWVLNSCSNFFLRAAKLNEMQTGQNSYSSDEIKLILTASHLHGELNETEKNILEQTLEFSDLDVIDIMRPIDEMVSLDITKPIDALIKEMLTSRYSRYPIIDKSTQNILGIIHIKDIFTAYYHDPKMTSIIELVRPVLKVPVDMPTFDLLQKFREGSTHFAIIYQGSESPIGFTTLDNLLHIIVGKIKDEFHRTKDDWVTLPDGGLLMKGNIPLYSVERALDIDIDTEDETATLYGLITNKLGGIPKEGDNIEFDLFTAVIQTMDGANITLVKIYPKKIEASTDDMPPTQQ